jgi:HD-GYP domain-containing protein (c-di-GMP phosphodiesterase class II)
MPLPSTPHLVRPLTRVALATLLVAVCPILAVWGLRATGELHSELLSIALVMALSLLVSYAGGVFWRSRPGSGDILFSELMVWGWIRRSWTERRLASALELIEGADGIGELGRERRERLLARLAAGLEARDPYMHGHSHRVARHAAMIAKGMGLSHRAVSEVRAAGALHDVGKLNTPMAVLQKPGALTDAEFGVIKLHPVDGAEMVSSLGDPELTAIVRHHHERLDGSGYPDHLSGDDIPLGARIIAVADTFDAITSTRSYRPAKSHKKALEVLSAEAGTRLDPAAVSAFQRYYSGRRPLALWVTLSNLPGRLLPSLGGGANVAAASSVAKVMAVSALSTGAIAVVAVPLVAKAQPALSRRAPTSAAVRGPRPETTTPRVSLAGPLQSGPHAREARGHVQRDRRRSGAGLASASRTGLGAGPGSGVGSAIGGQSSGTPQVSGTSPASGAGPVGTGKRHGGGQSSGATGGDKGKGGGHGNGGGDGNTGGDGHGNAGGNSATKTVGADQGKGGGNGARNGGGNAGAKGQGKGGGKAIVIAPAKPGPRP